LILETPGGLMDVVGDRPAAHRIATAAFTAEGSGFSFQRSLVAEDHGRVIGQLIRFPGADWAGLRARTGVVMLRAAGVRVGIRLLWRGPVEERLVPPLPPHGLYVMSLAIAPGWRGRGVGRALLEAAVGEAAEAGLRSVALDVAGGNEGAISFYERNGFARRSERTLPPMRGLPAMSSIRMTRAVSPSSPDR